MNNTNRIKQLESELELKAKENKYQQMIITILIDKLGGKAIVCDDDLSKVYEKEIHVVRNDEAEALIIRVRDIKGDIDDNTGIKR